VLKKYCTLVIGYTDKSQYSAPEVFTEKGSLVSKQGTPRDVYSFGLILYEIFTEITPFHDLTLKQCQQMIEEQQFRPKLKELVPEPIAQLI
jgi:serine/threonine protein kinase